MQGELVIRWRPPIW